MWEWCTSTKGSWEQLRGWGAAVKNPRLLWVGRGDSGDLGQMRPQSLDSISKRVEVRTRAQACAPSLPILNYTLQ